MEQQTSGLESQAKRIADSLERIEQFNLRQAVIYDENGKKWDADAKKWERRRLVTTGFVNLFVFVLALTAFVIALAK